MFLEVSDEFFVLFIFAVYIDLVGFVQRRLW